MRLMHAAAAGLMAMAVQGAWADVRCTALTCEYRANPVGIDVRVPRMTWQMRADGRGEMQGAYQVLVASSLEKLRNGEGDLWDSGKVPSDQSNLVAYGGKPMESGERCYWKVRVWDQNGQASGWSAPAMWEMGLLRRSDWGNAEWIGMAEPAHRQPPDRPLPARYLRREFTVAKRVTRATAYVCGLGLFELHVNGTKVGNHVLEPAATDYDKRCDYVTFDVTNQLQRGENALGVILGNGRYWGLRTKRGVFDAPKLLMKLHIEYADGTTADVVSDRHWQMTDDGPIRANNEYDGEIYDATKDLGGWDRAGYVGDRDAHWRPATLIAAPEGKLAAQDSEPIRITERLRPIGMKKLKDGTYIYDMGQNMVGWCRLKVKGEKGQTVKLRFAETLKPDGELYTANLRSAKATDLYTLRGNKSGEVYEPRFTYHGFRYVELTGYPGTPALNTIEGEVVNDDLQEAGEFGCSNDLLNDIARNIFWGVRGNYRSIATDCPQRDERQGWLGDRGAEAQGEASLFNIAPLYTKILLDVADSQKPDGSIPDLVPPYYNYYKDDVTWPSFAVLVPGMLYEEYGDKRVLETSYPVMAKWMALEKTKVNEGITSADKYGDWCPPPESPELVHAKDPQRITAGPLLATAYYYHDLKLMQEYADVLGKNAESETYGKEAEEVKRAFNKRFYRSAEGEYDNGSQTSFVLPLAFGLVPKGDRGRVFSGLVDKIVNRTHSHLGTGLIGGQWLMRTLSDNGRPDLAYTIATQKTYPSWGYMVENHATTIWELWNGNTANPSMNSGNHVMLIGDLYIWMNEYLAGIRPDPEKPGYKHIVIEPVPVGNLNYVRGSRETPYGQVVSMWLRGGKGFALDVQIPPNTTATVHLPAGFGGEWRESGVPLQEAQAVRAITHSGGSVTCEIGSGHYRFAATGATAASAAR